MCMGVYLVDRAGESEIERESKKERQRERVRGQREVGDDA